ncbi:5-dehydro-4-deoxyglucarate dehydratase [Azospirillum sp. RWY-5-1]|uniref:Probable 5-dehydro-4-deoxyglucarate dehydratase n=1 Tax=Azospirillum oleiclasticum TaxID=2735135 RepID=A0ABX2T5R8_9PROT|nr:5-dehydro-4-deoxyglucarate dehydratase [Azospirillum oleiclasticum]NYZ12356.1 5-dehydro-4-deoxyglucarate dehydratase [Azospirillum oleiclasticum]NYZ19516.1 5-dehydro-4-deoxyglucarate dehydratase [Azospirillum oleiclasticum]
MQPDELKHALSSGLLSFPVTDFDAAGEFDATGYRRRLEWLSTYGASALFAAGGTGEFFSLDLDEYPEVVRTAVDTCRGSVPIVAGVGYGTRIAVRLARQAEELGAAGILVLPHYLTEADQEGIARHVAAICRSVRIGVIVYNRGVCRLGPETLARLADECPNLIGFKDGIGDLELLISIRRRMGDRFAYMGGLPTAEFFAAPYRAAGVPVYSSAVFNFIPRTAMAFHQAVSAGDTDTVNSLLDSFFMPYAAIRNRRPGYAVSIVKAGADLVGHGAGPVRSPLVDLRPDERTALGVLIESLGPQ